MLGRSVRRSLWYLSAREFRVMFSILRSGNRRPPLIWRTPLSAFSLVYATADGYDNNNSIFSAVGPFARIPTLGIASLL